MHRSLTMASLKAWRAARYSDTRTLAMLRMTATVSQLVVGQASGTVTEQRSATAASTIGRKASAVPCAISKNLRALVKQQPPEVMAPLTKVWHVPEQSVGMLGHGFPLGKVINERQ